MQPILVRMVVLGLAAAVACDEPCTIPPCPFPIAALIRISNGAGGSVSNAFVKDTRTGALLVSQCSGAPAICAISTAPNSYTLEIDAAGFQSVTRNITVTGTEGEKCGCPHLDTQNLDVTLVAGL